MMKLLLKFEEVPHPYDETTSVREIWSVIQLSIYDESCNVETCILSIQWDVIPLLEWITENELVLIHEDFPLEKGVGSIAERISFFYEFVEVDDTDEEIIEKIYEYRTRHDLRFALRGTDIDSIIIGKSDHDYTISLFNEQQNWEYKIDIYDFIQKAKDSYNQARQDLNTKLRIR